MTTLCAYFDCFSGASGDMLLGALLDAGLPLEELRNCLASLPIQGYEIIAVPEMRQGVWGTKATVRYEEEQPYRHLIDILEMIAQSMLPAAVKNAASAVFWRLARAEAQVHGVTPEEVHFHEIGALDSIVDIVGVIAGLHLLHVEETYASPLPLGGGTVQTEHGTLPVPAPATLRILAEARVPTRPHPAEVELVTPTGAALLAEMARFEQPAMTIKAVGYGFGTRLVPTLNAVRVWLGKTCTDMPWAEDEIALLECNLDDATGQVLGYVQGRLLEAGALDVWYTPIYMKKNRPGALLSVLSRLVQVSELVDLMLRETPTLGVRWQRMPRFVADRTTATVETPWGNVRVKVKLLDGQAVAAMPEFEDCARLARETGISWQAVHDAAKQAWAASLTRNKPS
ncbi:MAG: nickel pincer cofactor biosynthesis protein LarC [Anaerolineae bacterium]